MITSITIMLILRWHS